MRNDDDLEDIRNLIQRSLTLDAQAELLVLGLYLQLSNCVLWARAGTDLRKRIFEDFLEIEKKLTDWVWSLNGVMDPHDHLILRVLTGRKIFVLKEELSSLMPDPSAKTSAF